MYTTWQQTLKAPNYFQSVSVIQLGQEHWSEGGDEGTWHLSITESTHSLLPAMAYATGHVPSYFSFAKEVSFFTFYLPQYYSLNPNRVSQRTMIRITGHCRKCPLMYYTGHCTHSEE